MAHTEDWQPVVEAMAIPIDSFDFAQLSAPERLLLAQQLVDSVLAKAMPLTETQYREVQLRAAQIDAGEVSCEPWERVLARMIAPARTVAS